MSDPKPWWAQHLPDVRGWSTIGLFALVAYDLYLTATVPAEQQTELFKTISTLLFGSGAFGLLCAFLWGGSKATTAAIETVNRIADKQPVAAEEPKK